MRVIFMGNPAFAVPSLQRLLHSRHSIVAVVSNPQRPMGRGRKPRWTPVGEESLARGVPLIPVEDLNDPGFHRQLRDLEADVMAVVAFRILPKTLIQLTPLGAVNLHASLLPRYRGAAPIQWALIQGDTVTGVTTFQIKPRVDTGDILLQTSVPIHPEDTYGSLAATLATVGADLLVETLDRLESGTVTPVPQSTAGVSRAPKITPEMQILRWDRSAESLRGWIRALSPRPEAYTILRGKRIGITRASVVPEKGGEAPGTVVKVSPGICWVQTGEGLLAVEEVHPQGKRVMSIRDYLAGRPLSAGDRFET